MTGTTTVGRETPTPDGGRRTPAPPAVASPWAETVARWGGRILQVYAVWLLVALILRPVAHHAERPVAEVLSVTNVPSYPSLFSAVVVGLVASGFLRRQRAALWFVVLVWQLPSALVMLLAVVLDRVDPRRACSTACTGRRTRAASSASSSSWCSSRAPRVPARIARGRGGRRASSSCSGWRSPPGSCGRCSRSCRRASPTSRRGSGGR